MTRSTKDTKRHSSQRGDIKIVAIVIILILAAAWFFLAKPLIKKDPGEKQQLANSTVVENTKSREEELTQARAEEKHQIPAEDEKDSSTISNDTTKADPEGNWKEVEGTTVISITPVESSEGTVADAKELDEQNTEGPTPIVVPAPIEVPVSDEDVEPTAAEKQAIKQRAERKSAGPATLNEPVPYVSNVANIGGYVANSTPPDTTGAAGPNHLVATTNDTVRITQRDGTLISSSSLKAFWTSSTNGNLISVTDVFDPRVIFDPIANRFIIAAAAQRRSAASSVLIAVSATADASGTWYKWQFDHDPQNIYWADYPYLGTSADKITVSVNSFSINDITGDNVPDDFQGVHIFVINKNSALDGGAVDSAMLVATGQGGSLSAALNFNNNGSPDNNQYLIRTGTANIFGSGYLSPYRLTGPITSLSLQNLPNSTNGDAWSISVPNAPQKGTSALIEANDSRMANSVFRDGYIWTAHTVALSTTLRDHAAIYWWQVDASTGLLVQQGVIEDTTSDPQLRMHYYYPSIAVNKNHDVVIGYSGSSKNKYVGAYYSYRRGTDPLEYLDEPVLYQDGAGTYSGPRWGDYSNSVVDPVDDLGFFTIQEFASGSNAGSVSWGHITSTTDTTAPKLTEAAVVDSTHVQLTFNEALLDNATLRNPTSYIFATSNGIPLSASAAAIAGGNTIIVSVNNMSSNGNYTITLPASGIKDLAGNDLDPGFLSANFIRTIPPVTVSLASNNPNPTHSVIAVTVDLGAAVSDFTQSDLQLTNATASAFTGSGSSYSFTLTPIADGLVGVVIPAGAVTDEYGTTNSSGASLYRTYDHTPPTVTLSSGTSNPTNQSPFVVTATFSEPVTEFASFDVTITGGTVQSFFNDNVTAVQTWELIVTPTGEGTVILSIPRLTVRDLASNYNLTDSAAFSRTYSSGVVGTTLSSTSPNPTKVNIPFTVTFGSSITGFNSSNISITNGNVTTFSGSGANYSFTVTPAAQGIVLVSIPANAGLGYEASGQLSRTFDSVSPTVTLSSTSSNPTHVTPILVQVATSEAVTGFVQGDILTENGTVSNFTGSGSNYSFSLNPSGQGVTTAEIPASAFSDAAGNTNSANAKLNRTFDSIPPPSPTINVTK
jgi:hypothetical protein